MLMNWNYIAGFFDGEGSVSTLNGTGTNLQPVVTFAQSGAKGFAVLTDIRNFLIQKGITNITKVKTKSAPKGENQQGYGLEIGSKGVLQFLTCIIPLLHVKRVAAQDVARAMKLFPPRMLRRKF